LSFLALFVGVREYSVGSGDFFELLITLLVSWVLVRMVLHGQFPAESTFIRKIFDIITFVIEKKVPVCRFA